MKTHSHRPFSPLSLLLCSLVCFAGSLQLQAETSVSPISPQEVEQAQHEWALGIIAIGERVEQPESARARATDLLNNLYDFSGSGVLFKPTLAADQQFRGTFTSALSYFIGDNPDFPEDKGFALNRYVDIRFENTDIQIHGTTALAMGNYYFTDVYGDTKKVEYSFAYRRDARGGLRIVLHHSSLPYNP